MLKRHINSTGGKVMKQVIALLIIASCLALTTSTLHADMLAYDNLVGTSNFPFIATDGGERVPTVDDLDVIAGGALTQVSFAIIADTLGGAVDAQILLAEDNGDGIPDFGGPGATDALLLNKMVPGVNGPFGFIPTGNALVVDVDVSADGVTLTPGSTVWAFLSLTRFGFSTDVNSVFYGPIGAGASDALVYQQNLDGSFSSVVPPDNDTSDGLGWQLHVVPEPATALLMSLAGGTIILKRRRRVAD
jgi:hypothetical protein